MGMDLYSIYILSMAVLSIAMVVYMVVSLLSPKGEKEAGKRVVTVLVCPECGYRKVREFREGDFVGKVVDEKCPKCGSSLVIDAIYEESIMKLSQALREKNKPKRQNS